METGLNFSVKIGDLHSDSFNVVKFTLDEALSELFTLTLTLSSRNNDIALTDQLLQKVEFVVYANGQKQRAINGIVASATRGDSDFEQTFYTIVVRPPLWQLTLTEGSQAYHLKSVPEIIDEILNDFGIAFDKRLTESHSERNSTTMEHESYADFIFRLMSEEGITFWHEENQLIYSDSHLGMTAGIDLIYNPHLQKENSISQLSFSAQVRPTQVGMQHYSYHDEDLAEQFNKYRLEALQADSELGEAISNCLMLMPGKIFNITNHPSPSMNNSWQITKITHHSTSSATLNNQGDDKTVKLINQFNFIPGKKEWRPMPIAKPLVSTNETIGSYQLTVGESKNETVALNSMEETGVLKKLTVGKRFEIVCGETRFAMSSNGKIVLTGRKILIDGDKLVDINGDKVEIN
ncbi:contractile injection system protein, VgrG/Pvc8 family [Orbaceae bacterium ac157xtp]